MKSLFRCPVCGGPLDREERVYRCADRHSYDIAKEGYTYLLPPNQKHSADPGDDKAMSAARRDFLSKEYYMPLLNTAAGKTPAIAGIDISKSILRLAAKREKQVEFAVASCYHLPFADETADLLLDCFSPLAIDEFRRVLKPGGHFLYVVPGADHLWELKRVLYDAPYPNEEKETPYEGFTYEAIVPVDFTLHLANQADIQSLFRMTPYCWKTPKAGVERMEALENLDCQASFRIHIFKKL